MSKASDKMFPSAAYPYSPSQRGHVLYVRQHVLFIEPASRRVNSVQGHGLKGLKEKNSVDKF